jgi:hypothetical protein
MKETLDAFAGLLYALPKGFTHSPCWNSTYILGILGATERQGVWKIEEWSMRMQNDGLQVGTVQ